MKFRKDTKENNLNENIIKSKKPKTSIHKERNQKALKKIFINLIIAIFIMLYLVGINLVYGNVQQEGIITVLKISTLLFLAVGLILIELAYKKESGILLINAIEALIFATHNLTTMHTIKLYNFDFRMYILTSSYIFSIYYVLKTIIIYTKDKRDYLKSLSDIQDIVKKDEPLKKEATKKSVKEEITENENTKSVITTLENSKTTKTSKKTTTNKTAKESKEAKTKKTSKIGEKAKTKKTDKASKEAKKTSKTGEKVKTKKTDKTTEETKTKKTSKADKTAKIEEIDNIEKIETENQIENKPKKRGRPKKEVKVND